MSQHTTPLTKPEEAELAQKRIELSQLESDLADRELGLTVLRSELSAFERAYLRNVGTRYSELDEIEAKIAERLASAHPKDQRAQDTATQARCKATASRILIEKSLTDKSSEYAATQSQALKGLYREVAKRIHPDLATDSADRARREQLMIEANRAYEEGDEARLREILEEYEFSPESVTGEGTAADWVRVIRKTAQVKKRLKQIDKEVQSLRDSELFDLKIRADRATSEGRNILREMAEELDAQIASSRERLKNLSPK